MMKQLEEYRLELEGCRFCPMCKPAAEVANVTNYETHTTRVRAMILWRSLNNQSELSDREVETLFQSTLDSISESWCISHYRVSDYLRSARRVLVLADRLPAPVEKVIRAEIPEIETTSDRAVLLMDRPGIVAGSDPSSVESGWLPRQWAVDTGVTRFWLGADDAARSCLSKLAGELGGVEVVVTAGAEEQYALTEMAKALGVALPDSVRVVPLATWIGEQSELEACFDPDGVFFHDSRAAAKLCSAFSTDAAIQPQFTGPEDALGVGSVYDEPRQLLKRVGYQLPFVRWQRALSRSSGADDALDLTYPDLAGSLAEQRVRYLVERKVRRVVVDSLRSRTVLTDAARRIGESIPVNWIAETVRMA